MSIPVTEELVRHIALLARLGVSNAEEVEGFRRHFEKVLSFVEDLAAVDTEGVDATFVAAASRNVLRDDEERPSLPRALALRNAPRSDGVHFIVPRVVGVGVGVGGVVGGSVGGVPAPPSAEAGRAGEDAP